MATVTFLGSTWTTTAGNKIFTGTPSANDLIVVIAPNSGAAAGTSAVTDDNSSGTYTKVDSVRIGFSTGGALTAWIRDSLVGSGVSTIFTAAQTGSSGGGLAVFAVSGMTLTGSSAARSTGGESTGTAGNTPAPVLSNTPLSGNPIIACVANGSSPAGMTPRSSPAYTEAQDEGYLSPTTGFETMFINSGETSATITWGGTSATAFASIAVELSAAAVKTIGASVSDTDTVGATVVKTAVLAPAVSDTDTVTATVSGSSVVAVQDACFAAIHFLLRRRRA